MAIVSSFQAMGKTYKANAAATSQTLVITADGPCNQICVANHQPTGSGGFPVYFNVSSNASITVSAPTNGSPSYALVSVPGTIKTYTINNNFGANANVYVAFVTDAGATSECYFTPGEGL
jgi:hypothetical protein